MTDIVETVARAIYRKMMDDAVASDGVIIVYEEDDDSDLTSIRVDGHVDAAAVARAAIDAYEAAKQDEAIPVLKVVLSKEEVRERFPSPDEVPTPEQLAKFDDQPMRIRDYETWDRPE